MAKHNVSISRGCKDRRYIVLVGQEEEGIVHPPEINFSLMFLDWKNTIEYDLLC